MTLAAGVAVAGTLLAWRTGWLAPAAGVAATAVAGTLLATGGWLAGGLLATFVMSASLLTRWLDPDGRRAARRSAGQVLANGGIAAVSALLVPAWPALGWPLVLGALAAAQADTWATEIGRTSRRPPRDLWTGRHVPVGTSGGVTWRGITGGLAGACLLAAIAAPALGPGVAAAGAVGGTAGMLLDSAMGGTVQARYLCRVCGSATESPRHCGTPGARRRGLAGVTNSTVNAVSAAAGGSVALWLSHWWS